MLESVQIAAPRASAINYSTRVIAARLQSSKRICPRVTPAVSLPPQLSLSRHVPQLRHLPQPRRHSSD